MVDNSQSQCHIFQEALLNPSTFCISWEQVPGRGAFEKQHQAILEASERAAKGGRVHAISITDGPGGSPAIASTMLGAEIKRKGVEPLVHFALRDANRIAIESLFYGLNSAGVCNLLVISGDFPARDGYDGQAGRVFDLDPTQVLQLIKRMNEGLQYEVMGKTRTLTPTNFFAGVAVSPFKKLEAEVIGQYYKLENKIRAGARFIISQIGFDARKMQEPILWLKQNGHDVPMLANIYVLSYPTARLMNANKIPGCVVTDKLVTQLEAESQAPDKGVAARLLRAAKLYAVARGLGYKGAHIGGHNLSYDNVEYIIDKGEELYPRWQELIPEFEYPQKDGFYLYAKDEKSGLNTGEFAPRPMPVKKPFILRFSRLTHRLFFQPGTLAFKINRRMAAWTDHIVGLKRVFERVESQGKGVLYECLRCGDCSLPDMAYICPVSQCPKGKRLGPCGGSYEGWCEVYPNERQCVWVRVYERLKAYHEEDKIKAFTTPPRNWELWQTSSWFNYFLGRDHTAKRLGIEPPDKVSPKKSGNSQPGTQLKKETAPACAQAKCAHDCPVKGT
ncbi:MAG: methylenetetrahydrofolate reductase C-terminal domain-containing protein [Dehalococcoidales bacterium]|nr:methylenetetrahydrofolate reductase C-terminal domain-containing protein [Dehalococcoidales bacterium]